jgi:hypothetical protein
MLGMMGTVDKTFVLTFLAKSAMTAPKMNKMRQFDPAETILRSGKPNHSASFPELGSDRAMAQIRRRILRELLLRIEREHLFYTLPKQSHDAPNPPQP